NATPFSAENTSTNEFEGFDVDIGRYVAAKLVGQGVKVQLQGVTKATRVPMIQGGEIDLLLATLTITEERKQIVDFSRPYYPSPTGVMVLDDSPIRSVMDLKGKTNCNPQGSAAWDFFKMALEANEATRDVAKDLKVTQLPSPTDCLLALRQKRGVDFVASDYATLAGQAAQAPGLRMLKELFGEELNSFGIAMAKGQPELLAAVDAAVCASFEDGAWMKIYSKWFKGDPPAGWPQKC
ncbi:MAG: transporter substrate-binding domain-containing protein, partial [Burkholderiaceae bacterium]|nr:transporter substrate-binding domain-containing protein [Burkholderiaceae bacterium]